MTKKVDPARQMYGMVRRAIERGGTGELKQLRDIRYIDGKWVECAVLGVYVPGVQRKDFTPPGEWQIVLDETIDGAPIAAPPITERERSIERSAEEALKTSYGWGQRAWRMLGRCEYDRDVWKALAEILWNGWEMPQDAIDSAQGLFEYAADTNDRWWRQEGYRDDDPGVYVSLQAKLEEERRRYRRLLEQHATLQREYVELLDSGTSA